MRELMNCDTTITETRAAELRDRVARVDFLTREAAAATATALRLFDDKFDLEKSNSWSVEPSTSVYAFWFSTFS